jgi:hypothetical protein
MIIGSWATPLNIVQKKRSVHAVTRSTRRDYNSRAKMQNVRADSSANYRPNDGGRAATGDLRRLRSSASRITARGVGTAVSS